MTAAAPQYFVYLHSRPDVPAPHDVFYVGKGKGERHRDFLHRTRFHKNIVSKYGRENIGIKRFVCASEASAAALECFLIGRFRRMGIRLANLTDGGEGLSGHRHSDETKAKMRAAWRRRKKPKMSKGAREHLSALAKAGRAAGHLDWTGRKHTPETRRKISEARLAKPHQYKLRLLVKKAKEPRVLTEDELRARKEAASATQLKLWADPQVRRNRVDGMNRPEVKAKVGKRLSENNPSRKPEVRAKRSIQFKEMWTKPGMRDRMRASISATWTDERKAAFSANNPSHNPEVNAKKSAKLKGYKWKQITCPHCNLTGAEPPMKRYHFDNCKKREVTHASLS